MKSITGNVRKLPAAAAVEPGPGCYVSVSPIGGPMVVITAYPLVDGEPAISGETISFAITIEQAQLLLSRLVLTLSAPARVFT